MEESQENSHPKSVSTNAEDLNDNSVANNDSNTNSNEPQANANVNEQKDDGTGESTKSEGEYFLPPKSQGQSLKANPLRVKPGEITEEEVAAVERLKERFLEVYPEPSKAFTNTCFLRFYRGMKRKEEPAFEKLIHFQKWRFDNDVDNVMNQTDKFQKPLSSGLTVFGTPNRSGRPFSFNFVHKHNAYDRDINEMRLFIIYSAEYLVSLANPEEERFCIYFDLGKFSLQSMDYEVVKSLVDILQNNYQETLEKLYVIDAPFIFSACWAIIKGWLDPVTAAKVEFIRRDKIKDSLDPSLIPPTP